MIIGLLAILRYSQHKNSPFTLGKFTSNKIKFSRFIFISSFPDWYIQILYFFCLYISIFAVSCSSMGTAEKGLSNQRPVWVQVDCKWKTFHGKWYELGLFPHRDQLLLLFMDTIR